jgi:hypothetical protein
MFSVDVIGRNSFDNGISRLWLCSRATAVFTGKHQQTHLKTSLNLWDIQYSLMSNCLTEIKSQQKQLDY